MAPGIALPAVTMSEAQAYVRIETGEEEALLAGLIRTASALCEAFLGQVVIAREFVVDVPVTGRWDRLEPGPVQSIVSVEGVDANGLRAALPVGAYSVDIDARGEGWVRIMDAGRATRVRVSGTAGMVPDQNGVPEAIRQGVLRLVAHLFAARDGDGGEPPAAVTALWRPYRRMRLS
jgi:uncharacterized phiE125 gp8 family phage protein